MKRFSILFIFLATAQIIFSQQSHSFQFAGGIIMPMSSSKGLTASVQYNYRFSDHIRFYIYSVYSSWDKLRANFTENYSSIQQQTRFSTYIADDHILIPVYIGSRIDFNTNKLFTAFVTFEIGYSYLSYNSYGVTKEVNTTTGEVLAYNADLNSKKEITENLFGVGAGIGISRQLTDNLDIILSFKLNSSLNSEYYGFFSSHGTYTALSLGLNLGI